MKDQRAAIGEKAKFECQFTGNPIPDIIWYHNGKILKNSENIIIDIDRELMKTSCTIVHVSEESQGFYVCKAINDVSCNETRAKFTISSTSQQTTTVSEQTTTVTKTEEKTAKMEEKVKKVKKYIQKKKQEITKKKTEENVQVTIRKSENIVERSDVEIREQTEIVHIKLYKEQLTDEQIGKYKFAEEINEIMEMIEAEKFGPGELPLRELATIGYLVQHGITVNEITQLYSANSFPALKNPESQSALVQLVEREGHGHLISEVITEETTQDDTSLAATVGFRAFLRMIENTHVTIEEVITNFKHEDFISQEWKFSEAKEKIVETEEDSEITGSKEVLTSGSFLQ